MKRYPARTARAAHGIRAQAARGARGAWWVRRWLAALEDMRLGARLGRARQYALSGQVTGLVLDGPHVEAAVQGSRPDPYRVSLDFTAVAAAAATRVADALRGEPMLLARILAGDLPTETEAVFSAAGVPLFPRAAPVGRTPDGRPAYDVRMHCTCPDWARPCKHLTAVLLLLGEEVARRPALLLALRGVAVDALVPPEEGAADFAALRLPAAAPGVSPLAARLSPFARLGPIPFWRGAARCVEALQKIDGRVRPVAEAAADGASVDLRT